MSYRTDVWNADPIKWSSLSLDERIHLLRQFHCMGPCGQSSAVLGNRQALSNTLLECTMALVALQELYDCQNGAPLARTKDKEAWEQAMAKTEKILGIKKS